MAKKIVPRIADRKSTPHESDLNGEEDSLFYSVVIQKKRTIFFNLAIWFAVIWFVLIVVLTIFQFQANSDAGGLPSVQFTSVVSATSAAVVAFLVLASRYLFTKKK